MKILVTGGAGYIGSTVCSALADAGHVPVILDSLVTGKKEFTKNKIFYQADISDKEALKKIFFEHRDISHTIHCAALVVVPESVNNPYEYYRENVSKSNELFKNLIELSCKKIVFSSSASIYAPTSDFIVRESSALSSTSPYARTKQMMEMILEDFCNAYAAQGISLRYFNPIGADPKMRSGMHMKNPTHVLAKLVDVALGKTPEFQITGTQWPTRDGTGIRDYIHVWDLAVAHVKAIENFDDAFEASEQKNKNYTALNLGTGTGVTVKELFLAFERVFGKKIKVRETEPRPGDVAGVYANADQALALLGWQTQFGIEDAIRDALKWGEMQAKV